MVWKNARIGLMLFGLAAGGCAHLKGVVVDEAGGRPIPTAVLTLGRPDGIGVLESHNVDERGRFDFRISTLDLNKVYVYDSAAGPEASIHLRESELGEKMRVRLPRAPKPETPMSIPRE
jgi:hypothetical protein